MSVCTVLIAWGCVISISRLKQYLKASLREVSLPQGLLSLPSPETLEFLYEETDERASQSSSVMKSKGRSKVKDAQYSESHLRTFHCRTLELPAPCSSHKAKRKGGQQLEGRWRAARTLAAALQAHELTNLLPQEGRYAQELKFNQGLTQSQGPYLHSLSSLINR